MGFNKKVLSKAVSELDKAKAPAKPRDIITDPAGQWKYPGQKTRIPGSSITMQGVDYPVWAQPNVGPGSMMQPNQDYNFPGASYVDETPMAKKGGEADYEDLELTDEEIQAYRDGGYVVEELPEAQLGGPQNTVGPKNEIEPETIPVGDAWSPDYDLRRFTAEDPMGFEAFSHGKGHATDQYKLPNHPTFSDHTNWADGSVSHGSLYSNTENPGGEWVQKQDGSWNFNTSHVNRSNMSDEDLKWYFDEVEPGNTLNNNPIKKQGGYVQHELVKAQKGRTVTYTNRDDYDKAFAAESDSLSFYNNAKSDFKKFTRVGDLFSTNLNPQQWQKASDDYDKLLDLQEKKWHTVPYKNGDFSGEYIPNYTVNYKYKGPKSGLTIRPVGLEGSYREGYDFPKFKKPVVHNVYQLPVEEITPLKRMSFPQVARPELQIIPAAPYKKSIRYSGPRYGTLAGDENLNLPEGYTQEQREAARRKRDSDAFQRKNLEYQQQQRGVQPVVTRKQGGILDKAQGGKTVYSGPNRGLVGPSTPKTNGAPTIANAKILEAERKKAALAKQQALAKQKEDELMKRMPKTQVSDNTRTIIPKQAVSDINNAAFYNSPQETADREARKKEQAAFEKEQWNKYNKMSFAEKALDRTQAAIAHPILMAGNALTGNQGYIPGMGRGLMNTESPEYDKYLKATGQTKGQFEVSDFANMVNPLYWGAHAGNELHKGNYATGLLEAGLAFAGVPGSGRTAVQGVKSLAQDVTQGGKYLGSKIDKVIYPTRTYRAHLPGGNETSYEVSELAKKINKKGDWTTKDLTEAQHYLKGRESYTSKKGLLTGDDMLFTEYKVPFWKKNITHDKDVVALKKLQNVDINSNEFIIPNNKFLYPRRTNLIKAVPEEVKTFEELLPNGNMAQLYWPNSIPMHANASEHASKTYNYIEDQINAVTGHNMPLSYKFDGIIGNGKVNAPLVDWKQPRFAPNAGIGKFNGKTLPNSANVDFSKYLTQEEAVAARGERLISQKNKPGWNEQLTPNLEQRLANAVENHNPASEYAGEKLGSNTGGRSRTEVSRHPMNADKLNLNAGISPQLIKNFIGPKNKVLANLADYAYFAPFFSKTLNKYNPLNLLRLGEKLEGAVKPLGNVLGKSIKNNKLTGGKSLFGKAKPLSTQVGNKNLNQIYAAKFDGSIPGSQLQLSEANPQGWFGKTFRKPTYSIQNKAGNNLSEVPLYDQGVKLFRKYPFMNRYAPINKQKLMNGQFQWSTTGAGLQNVAEKYGKTAVIGGLGAGAYNAYNYDKNDPSKTESYTSPLEFVKNPDPYFVREIYQGLNPTQEEKNGGSIESWEDDLDEEEIRLLKEAGFIVEELK